MMIRQIQKAYTLSSTWVQLEPQDSLRVGTIIQNQSGNSDSFLVSDGRPTSNFCGLEISPASTLYEDIVPPQGEIWAKASNGTPTLTLVLKYQVRK